MLDLDDDHARVVGAGPFLVEAMGVVLDDPVVAGQMKPFVVVGLEVLVGWLFAETAESLGKMAVEDDQRIARIRVGLKAFGKEHVSAQVHGASPELGEQVALDPLVLDILGGRGLGDLGDDLVEPDGDRARRTSSRGSIVTFLRRAVRDCRVLCSTAGLRRGPSAA